MAFTFEEMKHISTYKYPEDFASIKAAQVGTHREGVKDGQALFSKYRPDQCITLLKEAWKWDVPYEFAKPVGFKIVNGNLPKSLKKLGKSFPDAPLDALESLYTVNHKEVKSNKSGKEDKQQEDQADQEENLTAEEKESDEGGIGRCTWKVSRCMAGSLTYLHIKQALKFLVSNYSMGIWCSLCILERKKKSILLLKMSTFQLASHNPALLEQLIDNQF